MTTIDQCLSTYVLSNLHTQSYVDNLLTDVPHWLCYQTRLSHQRDALLEEIWPKTIWKRSLFSLALIGLSNMKGKLTLLEHILELHRYI